MTAALVLYFLIGCLAAMIAVSQRHHAPEIPWCDFAITILIWPYTLYLAFKREED